QVGHCTSCLPRVTYVCWSQQVKKLFENFGRGAPDDMLVIVKKDALHEAPFMIPLLLRRRIMLQEPGQGDLDNRGGLAWVEDKGIGIRNEPHKRAHQGIAARGQ